MKTVKEVSEFTGISVRTLHYYDEIGLFKPTKVNDAGYRLYDDKAIDKQVRLLYLKNWIFHLLTLSSLWTIQILIVTVCWRNSVKCCV